MGEYQAHQHVSGQRSLVCLVQDDAAVMPTYIETSNFMAGSKLGGVQADGGYGTISPLYAFVKK